MYEELLENLALNNGLREINTYVKLAVGVGSILLCLFSTSYCAPLLIAVLLSVTILGLARIDVRTYSELFIIPVLFAVMSVSVIILISGGNDVYWSWEPFTSLSLSITRESINEGVYVFCRVIGGMSGLIFIALTTPMTDLFFVMRQCRIPDIVLDLVMIIYRSIFLILDHLVLTFQAQVMRLGYGSSRESIHSFATLCGAVFIASWDAGEDLLRAMDARCYAGKFAILGEIQPVEIKSLIALVVFLLAGSIIVVVTSGMTLI